MKFELDREYRYFLLPAFLVFFTWIALPPYIRLSSWLLPLACSWAWFLFFTSPYRVVFDNGKAHCQSIVSRFTLDPLEVRWVKETILFLVIRHSGGTVRVSTLVNDVKNIESVLKSLNPDIGTRYSHHRMEEYK